MAIGNNDNSANMATVYSVLAVVALTLLSLFLEEKPIPFYSASFVFGATSVFFFAVTYGTDLALSQSAGILTLLLLLNLSTGTPDAVIAVQGVLLTIFFFLLSVIPNIAPFVLKDEIKRFQKDINTLTTKVEQLQKANQEEHKESVAQQSIGTRQLAAKLSSRNTLLVTYARGLLQCGSVREIINLLFYNISKAFSPKQCVMLVKNAEKDEFVISRIIHKEHQRLENNRITDLSPVLKTVLNDKKPIKMPVRTKLADDIETELLIPVLLENEVHAVFSVCDVKDNNLNDDDVDFITVLGTLTSGAAEQITVVSSRQS